MKPLIAHRNWAIRQRLNLFLRCFFQVFAVATVLALGCHAYAENKEVTVDPLTRYFHVNYRVPAKAPDEITVHCEWSPAGTEEWRPAKVWPLISESAMRLLPESDWRQWTTEGIFTEHRAAGLRRTVVFNPYPELSSGIVDIDFRITVGEGTGEEIVYVTPLKADTGDVIYIEDWSKVVNADAVKTDPAAANAWTFRAGTDHSMGNVLAGSSAADVALPQLSYELNARGTYAIFVVTPGDLGAVRMRLSGDERTDLVASHHHSEEMFWRWAKLDRQKLVLQQPHAYTGYTNAAIDYVKLVPIDEPTVQALEMRYGAEHDKFIAGYFEPYSWAFHDNVQTTLQHREPLTAFAEANIDLVDIQIGRFGMKVVYESELTDQLLYSTIGDPIGKVAQPTTDNVGRMQQFTNTLDAELRYARELGLTPHANFGASNSYPGTPLQGDISKEHPDWLRGSMLRYEVPEVHAYVLALYREALELGAPGISIDFCRYPEAVDTVETTNAILRDLRALADEFAATRDASVPLLVRFPGTGVRRFELFDYATWVREGWVDYLAPSNIQGRHTHIDMAPYIDAVAGTKVQLLPCVDGLGWGLAWPGQFLMRVAALYDQGISGIYFYQADGRVLDHAVDRRTMRLAGSASAVRQWIETDAAQRSTHSKGLFLTTPIQEGGYHGWERLRLWTEGIPLDAVEFYLDGELVNTCAGPPYLLGTEEYASDGVIPPGDHSLRVRAKDGDGWLEQTFVIHGAG